MLAGHKAAERGDWRSAIDAFEQATAVAPDEMELWHWLALASLAGERQDLYLRACDKLWNLCGPNASAFEVDLTLGAWLVPPANGRDLNVLKHLLDGRRQHSNFANTELFYLLYQSRTGNTPNEFLDYSKPPNMQDQPASLLAQAMIWHTAGHTANARLAYHTAVRRTRSMSPNWIRDVCLESLQREVEDLLGASLTAEIGRPPRANVGSATTSDASSDQETRESRDAEVPE
jgi:hypothetical protein